MTATALDARVAAAMGRVRQLGSKNSGERRQTPLGIMLHYDASTGSDASAVAWFLDPRCGVSYDYLVTDDGAVVQVHADVEDREAWHAGVCMSEPGVVPTALVKDAKARPLARPFAYGRANSAYIGVSITTGPPRQATMRQGLGVVLLCAAIWEHGAARWGWGEPTPAETARRIVGHEDRAIFNPRDNPTLSSRWGQLGRKSDPTGGDAARPILSTEGTRIGVRMVLNSASQRTLLNALRQGGQ